MSNRKKGLSGLPPDVAQQRLAQSERDRARAIAAADPQRRKKLEKRQSEVAMARADERKVGKKLHKLDQELSIDQSASSQTGNGGLSMPMFDQVNMKHLAEWKKQLDRRVRELGATQQAHAGQMAALSDAIGSFMDDDRSSASIDALSQLCMAIDSPFLYTTVNSAKFDIANPLTPAGSHPLAIVNGNQLAAIPTDTANVRVTFDGLNPRQRYGFTYETLSVTGQPTGLPVFVPFADHSLGDLANIQNLVAEMRLTNTSAELYGNGSTVTSAPLRDQLTAKAGRYSMDELRSIQQTVNVGTVTAHWKKPLRLSQLNPVADMRDVSYINPISGTNGAFVADVGTETGRLQYSSDVVTFGPNVAGITGAAALADTKRDAFHIGRTVGYWDGARATEAQNIALQRFGGGMALNASTESVFQNGTTPTYDIRAQALISNDSWVLADRAVGSTFQIGGGGPGAFFGYPDLGAGDWTKFAYPNSNPAAVLGSWDMTLGAYSADMNNAVGGTAAAPSLPAYADRYELSWNIDVTTFTKVDSPYGPHVLTYAVIGVNGSAEHVDIGVDPNAAVTGYGTILHVDTRDLAPRVTSNPTSAQPMNDTWRHNITASFIAADVPFDYIVLVAIDESTEWGVQVNRYEQRGTAFFDDETMANVPILIVNMPVPTVEGTANIAWEAAIYGNFMPSLDNSNTMLAYLSRGSGRAPQDIPLDAITDPFGVLKYACPNFLTDEVVKVQHDMLSWLIVTGRADCRHQQRLIGDGQKAGLFGSLHDYARKAGRFLTNASVPVREVAEVVSHMPGPLGEVGSVIADASDAVQAFKRARSGDRGLQTAATSARLDDGFLKLWWESLAPMAPVGDIADAIDIARISPSLSVEAIGVAGFPVILEGEHPQQFAARRNVFVSLRKPETLFGTGGNRAQPNVEETHLFPHLTDEYTHYPLVWECDGHTNLTTIAVSRMFVSTAEFPSPLDDSGFDLTANPTKSQIQIFRSVSQQMWATLEKAVPGAAAPFQPFVQFLLAARAAILKLYAEPQLQLDPRSGSMVHMPANSRFRLGHPVRSFWFTPDSYDPIQDWSWLLAAFVALNGVKSLGTVVFSGAFAVFEQRDGDLLLRLAPMPSDVIDVKTSMGVPVLCKGGNLDITSMRFRYQHERGHEAYRITYDGPGNAAIRSHYRAMITHIDRSSTVDCFECMKSADSDRSARLCSDSGVDWVELPPHVARN